MKYFPDFVSALGVTLATAMAVKHRLPWTVWAALGTQAAFTMCMFCAAQAGNSRLYTLGFHSLGIALLFALIRAFAWPMSFWNIPLIPSLFFALLFVGMRIYWPLRAHYHRNVPQGAFIMLVYGGIFLFCGIITVLSLVESQPPKLRFAAMAMGINWVAQGVFAWVLAANHGKVMVRGVDLNEFLPQFMAIVCLAWLAVAWNTAQPEAARQHSVDELALSELQHLEARS